MNPNFKKPKATMLAIGIGAAPAKKSMPPSFGGSSPSPSKPKPSGFQREADAEGEPLSEETAEKTAPGGDTDDMQGGEVEISPEAVGYRSMDETCDSCKYNEGGMCKPLKIEIGSGCNLFVSMGGNGEEMDEEMGAGGSPMQGAPSPQVGKPSMGGM